MTNNYLICEEERNAFTVKASVVIYGKTYRFPIKIDTGCTYSVLPFRIIANVTRRESYKLKNKDIKANIPYIRSYGVSDNDFKKRWSRIIY